MATQMVFKTSILLGSGVELFTEKLLAAKQISNWQRLAPTHVNSTRILIIAEGLEADYERALARVKAAATAAEIEWRDEDYLTYGDPRYNTWYPPLTIPPNYVPL